MVEDHNRNAAEGGTTTGLLNADTNYYYQDVGDDKVELTEVFRNKIRDLSKLEIKELEMKIDEARPAHPDVFGIKRRFCTVCQDECPGYQANKILFSSGRDSRGEFATFCEHCNCPAYFHKIEEENMEFPRDLAEQLATKNIQSQDLNFNCVLAAFLVKNADKAIENVTEIGRLLDDEGLEIVSLSQRYLRPDETFFLRNRIVSRAVKQLETEQGLGFTKPANESSLKRMGEIDTFNMTGLGQTNPYQLDQVTRLKERYMQSLRNKIPDPVTGLLPDDQVTNENSFVGSVQSSPQHERAGTIVGQSLPLRSLTDVKPTRQNQTVVQRPIGLDTIPENDEEENKSGRENNASGIVKSSTKTQSRHNQLLSPDFGSQKSAPVDRFSFFTNEIHRSKSIRPERKTNDFKLKFSKAKTERFKKSIVKQEDKDDFETMSLERHFKTDLKIQELYQNEIVFFVLSSTTYQNLYKKLKQILRESTVPDEEIPLLYTSQNKLTAFEDCIAFCPNLFRLTKSIVVSEPLWTFNEMLQQQSGRAGRSQGDSIHNQYLKERIKEIQKRQDQASTEGQGTLKPLKMESTPEKNPWRSQRTNKATHYNDNEAVAVQRKLKIIENELDKASSFNQSLQRARTSKSGGRRVTFAVQPDQEEEAPTDIRNASWVRAIKAKELKKAKMKGKTNKDSQLEARQNKVIFNYGVMQDFFQYSGMDIQSTIKETDLSTPVCPAGIKGGNQPIAAFSQLKPQPCNIFAIAKVGLPNIIFPNTLDVKFSNYEDYESYVQISDLFFPDMAKSHQTVIVFRPAIVKNGLNELLIQILRANEFLIIKRKIRVLTKAEVAHLYREEKVTKRNSELYYNMMMSGPSEVVIASKIGAVYDAQTLFEGSNPFGRRRINMLNEGTDTVRKNVDAVDSLFEIAPFSSFNEFLDLEDFLVRNSSVKKYQKLKQDLKQKVSSANTKTKQQLRTAESLYYSKIEEIRREINVLQRNFNFVGFSSKNPQQASEDVCIFAPSIASIQEVVLVLNPIYNDIVEDAFELILRSGFNILMHQFVDIRDKDLHNMFGSKFTTYLTAQDNATLSENLRLSYVNVFHLSKIAADKEMRQRFGQSDLLVEDLSMATNWPKPLKPLHIPYLFYFMDTEKSFEAGLNLLYEEKIMQYTSDDISKNFNNFQIQQVVQNCLLVTVGDQLKQLTIDMQGNIVHQSKEQMKTQDKFHPLNRLDTAAQSGFDQQGNKMEPQLVPKFFGQVPTIHYVAEADNHGLFEIRFYKMDHLQKRSILENIGVMKRLPGGSRAAKEAAMLWEKFASLSTYYNEVNKICFNVCPAFYKFKIAPFQALFSKSERLPAAVQVDNVSAADEAEMLSAQGGSVGSLGDAKPVSINRVFEVEEHMGGDFIDELARMNYDHLKLIEHNQDQLFRAKMAGQAINNLGQQKSLPAYVYGVKLGQMARKLESVTCYGRGQLRGGGKIIYDQEEKCLRGELKKVTQSSYYDWDLTRYKEILQNFKKGWDHYLSVLETEIIEEKLTFILESLTFKYTRQPQFLIIAPDRIKPSNLRISEKIKILNKDANNKKGARFFKVLDEDLIDPNREVEVANHVDSVLQTLNHSLLKKRVDYKLRKDGTSLEEQLIRQQEEAEKEGKGKSDFSLHKDCALTGFDAIARRPKKHLIASLLWLINFNYRKTDRKTDNFIGDRSIVTEGTRVAIEQEYDEILDILKESLLSYYQSEGAEMQANKKVQDGKLIEEDERKDVMRGDFLDVVELKQEGHVTEFEKHIKQKQTKEQERQRKIAKKIDEQKRMERCTMNIDFLIKNHLHKETEERKKKEREELRRFLDYRTSNDKDGSKFMQMLNESKIQFGPHAIKLAEEYVQNQRKGREQITNPDNVMDDQEKISFVQMEYFLYGVVEADHVITEIQALERIINQISDEIDSAEDSIEYAEQQKKDLFSQFNSKNVLERSRWQDKIELYERQIQALSIEVTDYKSAMSQKETELLFIFRELMSVNFFVPDINFDRELQAQRKQQKLKQESYIIPLKVFWRPIETQDLKYDYEYNLDAPEFVVPVNPMPQLDQQSFGQYLAKPLRDDLQKKGAEKLQKLRQGTMASALHRAPVEKEKADLLFTKYMSAGTIEQSRHMEQEIKVLKQKTQKKPYEPDMPFE